MPFKSDAQRKWMFSQEPEMAKRWAKETPKGTKLPKKVKEAERNGHEGFEVQDFHQDMDPLDIREMPHLDADVDAGGKHLHVVDLRIERYPVSQQEKQRLMRAFSKTGVVGDFHGELLFFRPDSVEVIEPQLAKQLPRLPHGWDKIMKFVSEAKEEGNDGSIPENPDLPDPEAEGQEFKKVGVTHAIKMDEPFTVKTIENDEAEAKAGDFLCKGPKGDMWPVDAEVFATTYKPAAPKMEQVFKRK